LFTGLRTWWNILLRFRSFILTLLWSEMWEYIFLHLHHHQCKQRIIIGDTTVGSIIFKIEANKYGSCTCFLRTRIPIIILCLHWWWCRCRKCMCIRTSAQLHLCQDNSRSHIDIKICCIEEIVLTTCTHSKCKICTLTRPVSLVQCSYRFHTKNKIRKGDMIRSKTVKGMNALTTVTPLSGVSSLKSRQTNTEAVLVFTVR
jgi:hypothetical protein